MPLDFHIWVLKIFSHSISQWKTGKWQTERILWINFKTLSKTQVSAGISSTSSGAHQSNWRFRLQIWRWCDSIGCIAWCSTMIISLAEWAGTTALWSQSACSANLPSKTHIMIFHTSKFLVLIILERTIEWDSREMQITMVIPWDKLYSDCKMKMGLM